MSPQSLAGPPDQSSRHSVNGPKCRLARHPTLPIFVKLRQKVCEISAVQNFCYGTRKSTPKFTKFHWPNGAKFRHAPTRTERDIWFRKFMLPEKWTKVHQNPLRYAMHQCPSLFQLLEAAKKNCRCQTILERGNGILTYDGKCA